MHFVLVILLLGGGWWGWQHAESQIHRVLAGLSILLGLIASFGLGFFYLALHRDQKK
jgi:hypothetical protein